MKRDKNDRGAWDRSKCQSTNSCRQKKTAQSKLSGFAG